MGICTILSHSPDGRIPALDSVSDSHLQSCPSGIVLLDLVTHLELDLAVNSAVYLVLLCHVAGIGTIPSYSQCGTIRELD